jgi:hypothetical protein
LAPGHRLATRVSPTTYVVDPTPIPSDEMQRTFDWMKSWGFLEDVCDAKQLVDINVQLHVHENPSHDRVAVS